MEESGCFGHNQSVSLQLFPNCICTHCYLRCELPVAFKTNRFLTLGNTFLSASHINEKAVMNHLRSYPYRRHAGTPPLPFVTTSPAVKALHVDTFVQRKISRSLVVESLILRGVEQASLLLLLIFFLLS